MKTVNPQNLPLISYKELVPFQENLKDLETEQYEQLLRSIKKHGFFVPAFVWFNEGKPYIMDSHQRHRVLMHEEIEFENTGFEIPFVEIEAGNEKEAKEKLLLIASQYGHVTQEGIDEFAALAELELESIDYHFDALNWNDLSSDEDGDNDEDGGAESKEKRYTLAELKDKRSSFTELTGQLDGGFVAWLEKTS